jgi:hypothetical protein
MGDKLRMEFIEDEKQETVRIRRLSLSGLSVSFLFASTLLAEGIHVPIVYLILIFIFLGFCVAIATMEVNLTKLFNDRQRERASSGLSRLIGLETTISRKRSDRFLCIATVAVWFAFFELFVLSFALFISYAVANSWMYVFLPYLMMPIEEQGIWV